MTRKKPKPAQHQPDYHDVSLDNYGFSRLTSPFSRSVSGFLKTCGSAVALTCYAGAVGVGKTFDVARKKISGSEESRKERKDSSKKNWLENALILGGTSLPAIRTQVKKMLRDSRLARLRESEAYHSSKVSSRLIKKHSLMSGVFGGVACAPGVLPGIGTLGTIAVTLTADLAHLLRTQIELCYGIAAAYGVEMDEDELQAIALALIGFASTGEVAKGVSAAVMRELIDQAAKNYVAAGATKGAALLFQKIGLKSGGRALKIIPFLGIPFGASVNIASTVKVGKQAKKYFSAIA